MAKKLAKAQMGKEIKTKIRDVRTNLSDMGGIKGAVKKARMNTMVNRLYKIGDKIAAEKKSSSPNQNKVDRLISSHHRVYNRFNRVADKKENGGAMKKYQTPGSVVLGPPKRTKEVVVSPSGDYRTTNRSRSNPNLYTQSSRTRRTVQGALKGVPKVDMNNPPLNNSAVPLTPPPSGSFMKRGGSKKSTISKRKK